MATDLDGRPKFGWVKEKFNSWPNLYPVLSKSAENEDVVTVTAKLAVVEWQSYVDHSQNFAFSESAADLGSVKVPVKFTLISSAGKIADPAAFKLTLGNGVVAAGPDEGAVLLGLCPAEFTLTVTDVVGGSEGSVLLLVEVLGGRGSGVGITFDDEGGET